MGDACDDDMDEDGSNDDSDTCPLIYDRLQTDTDGDGQGDLCISAHPRASPSARPHSDSDGMGAEIVRHCPGSSLYLSGRRIRRRTRDPRTAGATSIVINGHCQKDCTKFVSLAQADADGDGLLDANPTKLTDIVDTGDPTYPCEAGQYCAADGPAVRAPQRGRRRAR